METLRDLRKRVSVLLRNEYNPLGENDFFESTVIGVIGSTVITDPAIGVGAEKEFNGVQFALYRRDDVVPYTARVISSDAEASSITLTGNISLGNDDIGNRYELRNFASQGWQLQTIDQTIQNAYTDLLSGEFLDKVSQQFTLDEDGRVALPDDWKSIYEVRYLYRNANYSIVGGSDDIWMKLMPEDWDIIPGRRLKVYLQETEDETIYVSGYKPIAGLTENSGPESRIMGDFMVQMALSQLQTLRTETEPFVAFSDRAATALKRKARTWQHPRTKRIDL